MTKWEYCVLRQVVPPGKEDPRQAMWQTSEGGSANYKGEEAAFAVRFKALGDQGWELVSHQFTQALVGEYLSVFKRPK